MAVSVPRSGHAVRTRTLRNPIPHPAPRPRTTSGHRSATRRTVRPARPPDPPFDRSGRRSSRPAPGRTKRRLHETGYPPPQTQAQGLPDTSFTLCAQRIRKSSRIAVRIKKGRLKRIGQPPSGNLSRCLPHNKKRESHPYRCQAPSRRSPQDATHPAKPRMSDSGPPPRTKKRRGRNPTIRIEVLRNPHRKP